ncbi:DUF924 family protein [Pseudooceanicola spongiae]|uniref:DUF924 family protein n=1 Tax=Pseudooceanicola spongiae TaxID=2613965 RepID=A0A7L9WIT9_9RHOB|nr:DUF924 family protein [Pseudooceanicola spongiae]QOL79823.1 DUF924 family protein [Pseudooceanicola spongiae]
MIAPDEVLSFWLDEVGPAGWYSGGEEIDQTIRDRFGDAWQNACDGAFGLWLTYPAGALAYVILMDQFPRNMFRGDGKAFKTDGIALAAAKMAIRHGWDMRIDEPARQFFYLPLMHSENLCDQERCIRLMVDRMPETGDSNMLHAQAHREVIRKFGRFPYRNEALDRSFTGPEAAYLEEGGYGLTVKKLQAAG